MNTTDKVLVALRRILRAIDLHSKQLELEQGLTVPQLIVLRALGALGSPTVGDLAQEVGLSSATISSILDRLVRRGYVIRNRSVSDKRRVHCEVTDAGLAALELSPSPLHERFVTSFNRLSEWEQHQILASLLRVAEMMDRDNLDVAPILSAEDITPGQSVEFEAEKLKGEAPLEPAW